MIDTIEANCIGLLLQRSKDAPIDVAREGWHKSILEYAEKLGVDTKSGLPFITINMQCGSEVAYQTFEDIPKTDVPCSCGDPTHWFVKYSVLEDK